MTKLTDEMKKVISESFPAFVATASKTGKPNVSPKGSLQILDDEHVAFAEMASPNTLANLKENPQVAIVMFNQATWGGCRISGNAELLDSGELFDSFKAQFAPLKMEVKSVVKIAIEEAVIMPPMKAG